MDKCKVLVVEDHFDSRLGIRRLLERAGFQVADAGSVDEAIPKIDGQAFALLDLHLPDGNGAQVCQAIRDQAPLTKVAFITAAYDAGRVIQELGQCPDAVFTKPLDVRLLLQWLQGD